MRVIVEVSIDKDIKNRKGQTMAKQGRGNAVTCKMAIWDILVGNGRQLTAYGLARRTGFTARHCQRTLEKMYAFGTVAYRESKRGKVAKRVWASVYTKEAVPDYEWFTAMERLI